MISDDSNAYESSHQYIYGNKPSFLDFNELYAKANYNKDSTRRVAYEED